MDSSKAKVVKYYDILFEKGPSSVKWDEFFLLKCRSEELEPRISKLDVSEKKDLIRELVAQCVTRILERLDISFVNACRTLCAVIVAVAHRPVIPPIAEVRNEEITTQVQTVVQATTADILFPGNITQQMTVLVRRITTLLVGDTPISLKHLLWLSVLKIVTATSEVNANCLCPYFCHQDVAHAIFWSLSNATYRAAFGKLTLRTLSILLCVSQDPNPVLAFWMKISDANALSGLRESLREYLVTQNTRFIELHSNNTTDHSLFERVFSILVNVDNTRNGVEQEESSKDNMDLEALFAVFFASRVNRDQVSHFFSVRSDPSNHSIQSANLMTHLISFSSFVFNDLKTDAARLRAKLCFLSLISLCDDPFPLSSLHDVHHQEQVVIFRPEMLHRPAVVDLNPPASALATAVLSLVTEYLVTHLHTTAPLEFFDLSLGIIHRILAFHQRQNIRLAKWSTLFNSLISLLHFLAKFENKLGDGIHPVCYRTLVVINFFLTFGDSFLPDGEAYERVYYELIRQESVFRKVKELLEKAKANSTTTDLLAKMEAHLGNVMVIIQTISPKFNTEDDLSEDDILAAIRDSFDSLALKLFDGLTTVDSYDPSKHQHTFFEILALKIVGRGRQLIEEERFDHGEILQVLSSLE